VELKPKYFRSAKTTAIVLTIICAAIGIVCLANPIRNAFVWAVDEPVTSSDVLKKNDYIEEAGHSPDAYLIETDYGTFWSDARKIELARCTDLSVITQFPNLRSLGIYETITNDYSPLLQCPKLTQLRVGGFYNEITDISFLEYCPNLKRFEMTYNNVYDLSPLTYCPGLEELVFSGLNEDAAKSLRIVEELKELRYLDIGGTKASFKFNHNKLEHLEYFGIDLSNSSNLKKVKGVTTLRATPGSQKDIEVICSMKQLESLDITLLFPSFLNGNLEEIAQEIENIDFSSLAKLESLTDVIVSVNFGTITENKYDEEHIYQLLTRKILEGLSPDRITGLTLYGNLVIGDENMDVLCRFTNLERLSFSAVDSAYPFDFIKNMKKLKEVTIVGSGTEPIDLTCISHLKTLETLFVSGTSDGNCNITGTEVLSSLDNLKHLEIGGDAEDMIFLKDLPHLEYLQLMPENKPLDLSVLSSLSELKTLIFRSDETDISSLSGLTSLEYLEIIGRSSESMMQLDLSPLEGNTTIRELHLSSCDADLLPLHSCSSLEGVYISMNRAGKDTYMDRIQKFKQFVPQCIVYYSDTEESLIF